MIIGAKTAFSRPESLHKYSHALANGNPNGWVLSEFLDAFYEAHKTHRQNMLEREPGLLGGKIRNGDITDAYLAATAEYLA
ncbi:MAG: hypothetical protein ACYCVG_03760 [Leptospirillum sp.]